MSDQAEAIRQFVWGEDSYDLSEDDESEDYVEAHLESVFCVWYARTQYKINN